MECYAQTPYHCYPNPALTSCEPCNSQYASDVESYCSVHDHTDPRHLCVDTQARVAPINPFADFYTAAKGTDGALCRPHSTSPSQWFQAAPEYSCHASRLDHSSHSLWAPSSSASSSESGWSPQKGEEAREMAAPWLTEESDEYESSSGCYLEPDWQSTQQQPFFESEASFPDISSSDEECSEDCGCNQSFDAGQTNWFFAPQYPDLVYKDPSGLQAVGDGPSLLARPSSPLIVAALRSMPTPPLAPSPSSSPPSIIHHPRPSRPIQFIDFKKLSSDESDHWEEESPRIRWSQVNHATGVNYY